VLVAGINLKRSEDGFPITNAGNDGGEERFLITNVGKGKVRMIGSGLHGKDRGRHCFIGVGQSGVNFLVE